MSLSPRFEFSHRTRAYNLARLRAEFFDLLVIGGGITGAGIAREAALRGYKVGLVEKNDFASGTSSQSSKLVHGGLPYLDRLQFRLIYQASQERNLLPKLAPHLVWPLPILHPIHDGPAAVSRINRRLWLYDGLALFGNVDRHKMLTPEDTLAHLPWLDALHLAGGAQYYDAQTNDARLTLETIRSAHRRGAVIVNHFRVEELWRSAGKRVDGICGRDLFSQEMFNVRARVVVNATGPWADSVLALDTPDLPPILRLTKGIHLLVPHSTFPVPAGVTFSVPHDGRTMRVLPYSRFTLIGTTETDYAGSLDDVRADATDVDYILRAVAVEFPRLNLQRSDVLSTYAGIRPLIGGTGDLPNPADLSREHAIWVTPSGLVNIAGGKLTTHRAMAQQLVDYAAKTLKKDFGIHATHGSRSARLPLYEPTLRRADGEEGTDELTRAQSETLKSLSPETREHLTRAYGPRQGRVIDYVRADPKLSAPIVDGFPYIWAEVPHAMEHEMALTVADVMVRRLDLFHQVPDGAVVAARDIGGYMARMLDWLDPDIEQEVADYAQEVALNREALK